MPELHPFENFELGLTLCIICQEKKVTIIRKGKMKVEKLGTKLDKYTEEEGTDRQYEEVEKEETKKRK